LNEFEEEFPKLAWNKRDTNKDSSHEDSTQGDLNKSKND